MDWGALLRNPEFWKIAIPTAAGVTGSVLGNRAQAGAIENSKEELEAARGRSSNWLLEALKAAMPYADWNLGEQRAGSDWAYNTGQDALDTGYGRAAALLNPYVGAGQNALARLSSAAASTPRLTAYKGQGGPGQVPGARGQVSGGPLTGPILPDNGGTAFTPVARTPYPRTAPPKVSNALLGMASGGAGPTGVGAGGPAGFDLRDNAVKPPNFAVRNAPQFGALGGALAGTVAGTGAGAAAGSALGSVLFPGIGTAAGLLVGALVGRLTRAGREREGATEAVKEFTNWFWNDVMPQYRAGKLTRQEAEAAKEAGWGQYTNWLDQNVHDSDVNRNSKTSQRAWLDEGLNGPNGWASGPGASQGVA